MKRASLVLLLVLPAVTRAQNPAPDVSKRRAQVFAEACTGYCHGPAGSLGGGAPRLAARGVAPGSFQTRCEALTGVRRATR
jgi:mono/diheme cytochrome c family protein